MSTAPPIGPAPAALPTSRGCWKGALYGCGGAAVLIVACLVGLGIYVQKRPGKVTDMLMERIRERYASDVTGEDKADLDAAYADFRRTLEAGRIRKEDLDRVRVTIKLGREVHREEVHELTRVFRESADNASGTRDTEQETRNPQPVSTPPPVEATPAP